MESTLLPVHELTDTLLSLTVERQPLLSAVPHSSCGHSRELSPTSVPEEESFALPFLPGTLFSVNKFFVEGLVAGGVSEVGRLAS